MAVQIRFPDNSTAHALAAGVFTARATDGEGDSLRAWLFRAPHPAIPHAALNFIDGEWHLEFQNVPPGTEYYLLISGAAHGDSDLRFDLAFTVDATAQSGQRMRGSRPKRGRKTR